MILNLNLDKFFKKLSNLWTVQVKIRTVHDVDSTESGEILGQYMVLFFFQQNKLSFGCENIHSWISLVGNLAFSHQDGIYGFKFSKRFSGDLFLRSHSFTLFLN